MIIINFILNFLINMILYKVLQLCYGLNSLQLNY